MRKSIRPVTLSRVIEVASLAVRNRLIDRDLVTKTLTLTTRRAREILLELQRMGILKENKGKFVNTKIARVIIKAYDAEKWKTIHEVIYENYGFYNIFVNEIREYPLTKDQILTKLKDCERFHFNKTAVDILSNWAERLGQVQRNLYNNKYYCLREENLDFNQFVTSLQLCYKNLNIEHRFGLKKIYIELAKLREDVCEKLRIKRDLFDTAFRVMFQKFIGKIELCGAPLTTSAKNSPSSLRTIKKGMTHPILSPKLTTIKEGKGVVINNKLYHYVAIFEPLKGGK